MNDIKERLSEAIGKKRLLDTQKKVKIESLKQSENLYTNLVKARWVITEVTRLTQERFKQRVESLITMVIRSVFNRDFKFELIMEKKRNKLECRPVIKENGNEFDPKFERGGGLIDVISFAFRIALWSLEKPKARNVFILDEPFRFVGRGEILRRVGKILKEFPEKLEFQIIMITHEKQLEEIADKIFEVSYDGIHSHVKCKKNKLMIFKDEEKND
jgi:DNA repair exonuclease SbcCD ATPase subunit